MVAPNLADADTIELVQNCGWAGCHRKFPIAGPLPEGWFNLLLWHEENEGCTLVETAGRHCEQATPLCPEHVQELTRLLKPTE